MPQGINFIVADLSAYSGSCDVRGGFKINAARIGTSKHIAISNAICIGLLPVAVGVSTSGGGSGMGCKEAT